MANGTHDEKLARADRIAEQSAKAARKAEQNRRGTQNAIANLRGSQLQPYREEMDSNSEVTVDLKNLQGQAKGIPSRALGVAIIILAIAAAVVAVLRFWPG